MNGLNRKITYNNYEALSVRVLNNTIFVKTFDKQSGKIFWFIGFRTKVDLIADIRRILIDEHKFSNEFFKHLFKDDYLYSHKSTKQREKGET